MEMIYRQNYTITPLHVDALGRVKPSILLYFAQEIAGEHCLQLGTDWDSLQKVHLFWALIRTKVEVTKLPTIGQTITVETWPMPATRTAYPRCTVGYDENGNECFKIIALWVLMDMENRSMVLPGKSGIDVPGVLRGTEPDAPQSHSCPKLYRNHTSHGRLWGIGSQFAHEQHQIFRLGHGSAGSGVSPCQQHPGIYHLLPV